MSRVDFSLYLITDRRQTAGRSLLSVLDHALTAGVKAVQLREKDLDTRSLLELAGEALSLTRKHGALLFINDRVDLVMALGADGVHLRSDSMPIRAARHVLGPNRLIGASVHRVEEVLKAETEGADFAVLGPIYDTPSKRLYGDPIGLRALEEATQQSHLPIFAIGGISLPRIQEVRRAGAQGVALISAILLAEDVQRATGFLLHALQTSD
ncbi:MAG TPA: thiamine phosphate synthase [Nitrospiraceae bacterium]|nr:thiamine phosphate synthase [Nitrospiraceae bacterium]